MPHLRVMVDDDDREQREGTAPENGGRLDFHGGKGLEAWLKTQPREVSGAIAARAALRVLPLLASDPRLSRRQTDAAAVLSALVLPVFRAMAAPWAAAKYPARGAVLAYAAARAADAAARAAYAAAAARAADADAAARAADADAAARAADAAARAAYAAARAAYAAARAAYADAAVWQAITADVEAIVDGRGVARLAADQLWPDGAPRWAKDYWQRLRSILLSAGDDWDVWVEWYEARLRGDPADEDLEIDRVLKPYKEELWKQGPAVVNARIKELIAEHEAKKGEKNKETREELPAKEPDLPAQGAGPLFDLPDGRLDHVPTRPASEEAADALQEKLFDQLKRRHGLLSDAVANLKNQYPILARSVADYGRYLDVPDLGDLDVAALWMTGAGLIEQARAFRSQDASQTMTPRLEPETDALLHECARLHGGFIMGFEEGRTLAERSGFPLLDTDEVKALLDRERAIVGSLLKLGELTDRTRALLEVLQREITEAAIKVEQAARIGYPVVRNVLIAVSGFAWRFSVAAATFATIDGATGGMVAAWLQFLQANSVDILAFASTLPELHEYFLWRFGEREIEDESRDPAA